jgi:hypothetical protein
MTIRLYGNSHYNPKPNVASLQADMATHSMLPPTMNSYRMMYNGFVRIWVMFMGRQEDFVLPGR